MSPRSLVLLALLFVVLAGGCLLRGRRAAALVVAGTLACAAASALSVGARVHGRTTGPVAEAASSRASVVLEGRLVDDPRAVQPKRAVLAFQPTYVARLRVLRLDVAGQRFAVRQTVVVIASDDAWHHLLPSQRVRVEGRLQVAEHGADVAGVLAARGEPQVLGPPSAVQRVAGHLRAGLRRAVDPLPPDERGLLPGLVVGDTSRLDPALKEDFRTTGLTHLTAVSGTNVAVVLGAALLLCGRLGVPQRLRPWAAGTVLVGFVVLARPSPSVLRAATMGGVALLALAVGTRKQALPALCATVLALVLVVPDLAPQPGFALSVLATAGLLLVAPVWRDRWSTRMPRWAAEALAVPAAAQLVCTPVVVAISGQLGVWAVPANVLAVPAVAPATVLGVLAALLAAVWLPAAQLVGWLAYLPVHWLVVVAHVGARQPGAGLGVATGWTGAGIAALLVAAGWVVLRRRQLRRGAAAVTAGALVAVVGLVLVRPGWPPPGWVVVSCDVGQGDAFVVRLGPGEALVVDNGPDPQAVDGCLRRLGIRRVPLLVLTHLHADHVEGVPGLLRHRAVGAVQLGPLDEPKVELDRVTRWLAKAGVPVVRARVGETRAVDRVRWTVLDATARRGTDSDPNNSSIVMRVEAAGIRVLLSGDLEEDAQQALVDRGVDLRADVLKVPHHGSRKQSKAFLDAIGAKVALTPVGADNPYGHPSAETLDHLRRNGTRVFRSDRDGDVAVVVRGGRISALARGRSAVLAAPAQTGTTASPVAFRLRQVLPPEAWCDVPLAGQGTVAERARAPPRAKAPSLSSAEMAQPRCAARRAP